MSSLYWITGNEFSFLDVSGGPADVCIDCRYQASLPFHNWLISLSYCSRTNHKLCYCYGTAVHAWKVWRNSSVSGAIKRWRNSRTLARSNYFWIAFPIEHLLMLIEYTGISVGEIGPKLGFNTVNNGYLGFEKVRIPRDHLLMKHSQVLEVIFF